MEGFKIKLKTGLIYAAFILLFFGFSFSFAHAANLFLAPNSGTYNVGNDFKVLVKVDSSGVAVNAAEGILAFDPNLLSVVALSKNGSIFNLWVQEPEFSNALGTVNFGGVILNPGFVGASGTLLSINFKAKIVSSAQIAFSSGAVLANDGKGTNVLTALNGGTYLIQPRKAVPQIPPRETPSLPVIFSSSHPDSEKWYSNSDPKFNWKLPEDVDTVSYLVHTKPTANPGNEPDGLKDSVSFTGAEDGISYFHLRFHNSAGWGPIAHYKFKTDTQSPEEFDITRLDKDGSTNPLPELLFATSDAVSGIDKYEMKIGDGDWFLIDKNVVGRAYKLPLQAPGKHKVIVRAIDQAGNSIISDIDVFVESIEVPVIDEITEKVTNGESVIIKGTAKPEYKVLVYFIDDRKFVYHSENYKTAARIFGITANAAGRVAKIVETPVDKDGKWEIEVSDLDPGKYRVHARAQDNRGAISNQSNEVRTQIGQNIFSAILDWILRLFSYLINGIKRGILFFGFIIVLVGLIIALIKLFQKNIRKTLYRFWGFIKIIKLGGGIKKEERDSLNKIKHMKRDIEEELELLEKIESKRELSLEERYLRNKLKRHLEYIKSLKPFKSNKKNKNL